MRRGERVGDVVGGAGEADDRQRRRVVDPDPVADPEPPVVGEALFDHHAAAPRDVVAGDDRVAAPSRADHFDHPVVGRFAAGADRHRGELFAQRERFQVGQGGEPFADRARRL